MVKQLLVPSSEGRWDQELGGGLERAFGALKEGEENSWVREKKGFIDSRQITTVRLRFDNCDNHCMDVYCSIRYLYDTK